MDLKGKVAIVTGASRGLGKAIALGFSKQGASVVVAARTQEAHKTFSRYDGEGGELSRSAG